AQSWAYLPELRLQAGQRYVAWVASTDVRHGFLLRDQGLSFLLEPGYAYRVELLFEEPGTYA
ncbi:MAG: cytochrome C oxidase subunit II, partial [Anaerolineae bacterium]|nr:cytochrome C oxidase subunit II [Anaerolineae bacterium]